MNRIIGKKAPDFHLKAVSGDGEDFFDVSLDTYKGHWLVLFFYPMDFTFVCPTEITTFSNDLYLFDEAAKAAPITAFSSSMTTATGPGLTTGPMTDGGDMTPCPS